MRERLALRPLLRPAGAGSSDPAVTASAFGALYTLGGLIGFLTIGLGGEPVEDAGLMAAASTLALAIGLLCVVGYRRLSAVAFVLCAVAGVGAVTLAAAASEAGSAPIYAPLYQLIALLGMLLFGLRPALGVALLTLVAYGIVLYTRDTPFATQLLLGSYAMLTSLAMLVTVVRTRSARLAESLAQDANVDALTGIPNRRAFDRHFDVELARAKRQRSSIALVLCDLDRFKRVNDVLGHEEGDEVLKRAARAITETTRSVDMAARVGGEEFGVILTDADPQQAATAAERIRRRIRIEFEEHEHELTISCGAASADGAGASEHALYAAADRALYAAKRAGRDCTAVASGEDVAIIGGGSPMGRLRQLL